MRIFTFRRLLGIGIVGAAYVHGKRGGDATFASISDTLRYLWSTASERLGIDKRPQGQQQRSMPQRAAAPKMSAPNGLERNPRTPGGPTNG